MKKNLLFLTFVLTTVFAFGQKLPFQGKLIESGVAVEGNRDFEFSIPTVGWSETHAGVTITDGLYFVVLGNINPLPDSLFYGVDEQNMNITVNGTPLSPVVIFKPLSTPFEGSELVVKNDEGTKVGEMKATKNPAGQNGEVTVYGPNGSKNAVLGTITDYTKPLENNNNDGAIYLYNSNNESKVTIYSTPYRGVYGSGELNLIGETTGGIHQGFNGSDDLWDYPYITMNSSGGGSASIDVLKSDTVEYGKIALNSNNGEFNTLRTNGNFLGKEGRVYSQLRFQDWSGNGVSGYLDLKGPNSDNVVIMSRFWEDADMPIMVLRGRESQDVVEISAEIDSTEAGKIVLGSKTDKSVYMNAEHISLSADSSNNYIGHDQMEITSLADGRKTVIHPGNLEVINTRDENNWRHLIQLHSQNWGSADAYSGLIDVRGPSSNNIQLTGKNWENPDLPWFKLSGLNNFDAIQMSVENDSIESGYINLHALDGRSSNIGSGWLGLRGPNSQNIDMGRKDWEDENFGYINMWGRNDGNNDFHAMEIAVSEDNGQQFGYINLMSENGKSLHISPEGFGVEGVSMSTTNHANGNFGSLTLHGPGSDNFQFMPGWWDQPDLPRMLLLGTSQIAAIDMGAFPENGFEVGTISLSSTDGSSGSWNPNRFGMNSSTGERLTFIIENNDSGQEAGRLWTYSADQKLSITESTRIGLVDDSQGWKELVMMVNHDFGNEQTGGLNIYGPNSENIIMGSRGAGQADIPHINFIGSNQNSVVEITATPDADEAGHIRMSGDNDNYWVEYSAGGISSSGHFNIHNNLDVNGDITAASVTETSDKRFKTNITSINAPLQKIKLLEGVSYYWRQEEFPDRNFSSNKQIGLIAQELEAQFPELVKTDEEGYKSVNYNGFTAVLLEAVKELNAKVEKLEAENIQLKTELSTSVANASDISQLRNEVEALVKLVQIQHTKEDADDFAETLGLK